MAPTEEACLRDWRSELLARATGDVLELGAGTGVNIGLYPPSIGSVTFCEPDAAMRTRLEAKLRDAAPAYDARVVEAHGEELPFEDETFDTLVVMLVLCSVSDVARTLSELKRVAKPTATLIFLEHVAAETGSSRRFYQGIAEPLWKRVAGNCHLTRDTQASIAEEFEIEAVTPESMRKSIALVRPTIRGFATPRK